MTRNTKYSFHLSFLLLIYVFSLGASALHVHEHEHVDIHTACDEAIYFGSAHKHCSHDSHVSSDEEKCLVCDHHVISEFIVSFFSYAFPSNTFSSKFSEYLQKPSHLKSKTPSNKGPPALYNSFA